MQLTKYKEGSLMELWRISLPLMLSSLSVLAMIFVDRLFLINYSVNAFNAVVNASTLGWAFILSWLVLGSISEVFVAQYNGSGNRAKIGEPIWQMLWVSLFSMLFFIPLAVFNGIWFFGNGPEMQMQRDYFGWMMSFGFSFPMYGALCGFFIGQGRVFTVTILAVSANFVNIVLDWGLIYGYEGWIPAYGVKGAAIATCTSQMFQVLVLLGIFLNKKNREECHTTNYRLKWTLLQDCLRIGFPTAICVFSEILAWAMYYKMLAHTSNLHITVAGISQSLIIVLYFFSDGISKGVIAIVGNLIGAKKYATIPKVVYSGVILHFIFFAIIFIPLAFFTEQILVLFLLGPSEQEILRYKDALPFCLALVSFYMLFEGLRFLFAGVLTAAGDTKFLMFTGATMIWAFVIFPVYIFIVKGGGSIELSQGITLFYACFIFSVVYWRYAGGSWQKLSIIQKEGTSIYGS